MFATRSHAAPTAFLTLLWALRAGFPELSEKQGTSRNAYFLRYLDSHGIAMGEQYQSYTLLQRPLIRAL